MSSSGSLAHALDGLLEAPTFADDEPAASPPPKARRKAGAAKCGLAIPYEIPLNERCPRGTATPERRREQNRVAQRTMRERHKDRIKHLEAHVEEQNALIEQLRAENDALRLRGVRHEQFFVRRPSVLDDQPLPMAHAPVPVPSLVAAPPMAPSLSGSSSASLDERLHYGPPALAFPPAPAPAPPLLQQPMQPQATAAWPNAGVWPHTAPPSLVSSAPLLGQAYDGPAYDTGYRRAM